MKNKLMLGLWRHIIDVPPFLWKEKITQAKGEFEKEHGVLSGEKRIIHHFVVKELPDNGGRPLSPELISEKLDISVDRIDDALDYLEKRLTFLCRNEKGEVVWAYPLTAAKTPHRITFDTGEKLYAA
jgi:hypothetical protein